MKICDLSKRDAGANSNCLVIRDDAGRNIAYFYFEDRPELQGSEQRMTKAEAIAVAQTCARALSAGQPYQHGKKST